MLDPSEIQDEELHLIAMAWQRKNGWDALKDRDSTAHLTLGGKSLILNSVNFGRVIKDLFPSEFESIRVEIQPQLDKWKADRGAPNDR